MKLTHLLVNRIATPLGFALCPPAFSWTVEDTDARRQLAAQVTVSTRQDFSAPVFDTGKSEALSSLEVVCDAPLRPRTRYYWRVTVWADNGEEACADSWFETGKAAEPWQGVWIGAPAAVGAHPLLARDFALDSQPVRARLYCTGLGLYETEVNGVKAGDEYLAPACNNYDHFVQVQTYDVTALLRAGQNRLGFWLGKGWYSGRFGFKPVAGGLFGDDSKLLAELVLDFADGSSRRIVTDESWQCRPSAVTESGIYDGEWYDARLQPRDWSEPGVGDDWQPVQKAAAPAAPLIDRLSLPIKIKQRLPKATLLHTPADEWVLDFGQEMTGWVEFDCDLPAGKTVQLQFGELLQHDNFYNENLRSAKEQYTYISDGAPAHVRPHFTFSLEVTMLPVAVMSEYSTQASKSSGRTSSSPVTFM